MAQIPYAHCNGSLTVRVELKNAADVFLLDEDNYRNFNNGKKYKYFGGHYTQTPVTITVEGNGNYYLIVRGCGQYKYNFY